jgi:hypothetical protein
MVVKYWGTRGTDSIPKGCREKLSASSIMTQPESFDHVPSAIAPNPVFCHQDFLEKLAALGNQPVGKRAGLLMQRLAVDERWQHYKSTHGANRGWRRSRLGGGGGNQFYAWWALKTALPMKSGAGFERAPEGSVFLRDIRHHDDHSIANAQSYDDHYLPVSVAEMRREEFGPAPWTPAQKNFAMGRQRVRVLKGHPGSGKTTALLHAADVSGAPSVLYLTYSRQLAVLARQYFDRLCSGDRRFRVLTYETFLRELLGVPVPVTPLAELRKRLRGDLAAFSRSLGAWTDRTHALYDELHAHLIGAALPETVGRFAASAHARSSEENYRSRRAGRLGPQAVSTALDLAQRLERNDNRGLAERYCPELALAWEAAARIKQGAIPEDFLSFECIAIDECQDLTPIEAFVAVELAAAVRRKRGIQPSLLLAGDEAQTVRPTDFEWGWMNDLLHHRVGTPSEYKLSSNLRSPRTLAQIINRVWDLYAEVEKQDRPSGTGYAEYDDDATDEVFYCTATPGEDLERLLSELSAREGVALVTLDEASRSALPASIRESALSVTEVKGLDFHTVCLVNGGARLDAIVKTRLDYRFEMGDIESIRRRLAIDELRVAVSRPADRLIWLDISPAQQVVRASLEFLNHDTGASVQPSVPQTLLTALAEEQLDLEERIQRCQADARQYLEVRPEIAYSRAQQAVTLLGSPGTPAAVDDEAVRAAAQLTLAEICFCLASRKTTLPAELGRPDLFWQSAAAATAAGKYELAGVISAMAALYRADSASRLRNLAELAAAIGSHSQELESWFLVEIASKAQAWIAELEMAATAEHAPRVVEVLPAFYDALRLPDAASRKQVLFDRAIRHLMKSRRYGDTLLVLETSPVKYPVIEAQCYEELGDFKRAAALYHSTGNLKEAINCYRAIPDFDAALELIQQVPSHSAAASYEWVAKLRNLVAERPANFNRVMQASEKKVLEELLEQALGATRKKPAVKKAVRKQARKTAGTSSR